MTRITLSLAFALCAAMPGLGSAAEDAQKAAACQFQADVIGAVQTARLDRVRKARVLDTVLAANPSWPASARTALPAVVEFVYAYSRRDLRGVDLAEASRVQCLENWDQIQQLSDGLSN